MKNIILFVLLAAIFVGCKKDQNGGSFPINSNNYTALNLKTKAQVVNMLLDGNVLKLTYNEDITVLIDAKILAQNNTVYLKEDFSGTSLAAYDYNSVATNGLNALNWVDDNLNNLPVKSSKDTLIAGKAFVKKHIIRTFSYQKVYSSAAEAFTVINKLEKQTDIIVFSTFSKGDLTISPVNNTAKLTYCNAGKNDVFTEDRS